MGKTDLRAYRMGRNGGLLSAYRIMRHHFKPELSKNILQFLDSKIEMHENAIPKPKGA